MKQIRTNKERFHTSWTYCNDNIYDKKTACHWLSNTKLKPNFRINYIYLKDVKHKGGNFSTLLFPNVNTKELYHRVSTSNTDIISLTGEYKGEFVVIGIDLNNYTISITLKNNTIELINDIQEELCKQ